MTTDPEGLGFVQMRYLERLFDHELLDPGHSMDSKQFLMEESGLSLTHALDLVWSLDDMGLVQQANGMGNPSAFLSASGREYVIWLRSERNDPAARAAGARYGVLAFVYDEKNNGNDHPGLDDVAQTPFGEFLGDSLREDEVYRAAEYLIDKRLLTAPQRAASGRPTHVQLTSLGDDCMTEARGDIVAFLRSQPAAGIVNHIGSISGAQNVVVGSNSFSQNINQGIDPQGLREIVSTLLSELHRFAATEPQARAAIEEIDAEAADPQPNSGRLRNAIGRLLNYAKQASLPMVEAYIKVKATELGILPPSSPSAP
jgi:hypothetical protein